jgi:hypothetical protein
MKINVGVIFGGKSLEHEISIISAVEAMGYFDKTKYKIIPIYMDKENTLYTGEHLKEILHYRDIKLVKRFAKKVNIIKEVNRISLQKEATEKAIVNQNAELDIFIKMEMGVQALSFSNIVLGHENDEIHDVINFFKPKRARLLSFNLVYAIDNPLFNAVALEDGKFIRIKD